MITLTAKITLADGTTYDVDKRNMISLDSKIIDRSNIVLPHWGIISNGGNISITDYDGSIRDLAENLKLNRQTKVNIFLKDTISGESAQVGELFASKWNYDNNTKTASANLTDGLQKMQDINIVPLAFNPITNGSEHNYATQIYDYLHSQTIANGFDMIGTADIGFDADTLAHLDKCYIEYPFIKEMTLWRAWQEFCEAFQLHIFKNRNGKIVCVFRGGD